MNQLKMLNDKLTEIISKQGTKSLRKKHVSAKVETSNLLIMQQHPKSQIKLINRLIFLRK